MPRKSNKKRINEITETSLGAAPESESNMVVNTASEGSETPHNTSHGMQQQLEMFEGQDFNKPSEITNTVAELKNTVVELKQEEFITSSNSSRTPIDSSTQQKVAALLSIGVERSLNGFPTTDPQEFERILSSYRFSEMQDLARRVGVSVRGSIHALMEDLRRDFAKKFAGRDNII